MTVEVLERTALLRGEAPAAAEAMCHTEHPFYRGRLLCGARMTGSVAPHSLASCHACGHARCVVCDDLFAALKEGREVPPDIIEP